MKRTSVGSIFIFLLMILTLSVGLPPKALAAETIKIGHLDPYSGPFEYAGRVYYGGIKFAVDEQNAKGGLLGKKIEIIPEDSELKPDVATRKAKKLILEDKVNFTTCGTGTHVAIALNKVATAYKTLFINIGCMGDVCQGKEFSRYAFRVCQNAYNSTSALAALMATKPYRRYYLINMDYAWGYDVVSAFKKQLKIHIPDAQVIGEDYHPVATKDYGPYITKAMAAKADVIFTGNYGPDSRTLIRQARALGLKVPFPFVTTFGVDPYVEFELKEDSVGIHYAYDYDMRVDTPENKAMYTKYHEQHKNDKDFLTWWPSGSTGHTLIGTQMFLAAVKKAGSLDPEKIIEAFEGFRYKTPVGWWEMRKCDHQVILPMFGGVVEAGKNPFYNGSIRPDVNFPWLGPNIITIPAEKAAIPATPDYNPRCK